MDNEGMDDIIDILSVTMMLVQVVKCCSISRRWDDDDALRSASTYKAFYVDRASRAQLLRLFYEDTHAAIHRPTFR